MEEVFEQKEEVEYDIAAKGVLRTSNKKQKEGKCKKLETLITF